MAQNIPYGVAGTTRPPGVAGQKDRQRPDPELAGAGAEEPHGRQLVAANGRRFDA